MRYIKSIKMDSPLSQDFELGDLTIFIGRSNSGKTRILKQIFERVGALKKNFQSNFDWEERIRFATRINLNIERNKSVKLIDPLIIESLRQNQSNIDILLSGLTNIENSAKKMDPTIESFGNNKLKQEGVSRALDLQGSGIQNMMQLFSKLDQDNNFILIDEPEISQSPLGKIEILKEILGLLKSKQVIVATHDPTIINQYLIKKLINNPSIKVVIYSYCKNRFEKIDFSNNIDPEIHCGYLSQTFSGKPFHLVLEGQTDFYAFQALLFKYCLINNIENFARAINRISLSYLAGNQWKINIPHLPPPEYYSILVILDGEHLEDISNYIDNEKINLINKIYDFKDGKVNILCLKSKNIEKSFEGIIQNNEEISKPYGLSDKIWTYKEDIIDKLEKTSEDSKQVFEILKWIISKNI